MRNSQTFWEENLYQQLCFVSTQNRAFTEISTRSLILPEHSLIDTGMFSQYLVYMHVLWGAFLGDTITTSYINMSLDKCLSFVQHGKLMQKKTEFVGGKKGLENITPN